MNLTGRPVSIAYAVLLAGCAWLAWRQLFGMMFAMGESETTGFLASALVIGSALGIVALAVAALGSWTRRPFFSMIAMLGSIGVLPMASIYFKQSMGATIWQYNAPWVGATGILALVLDIAAVWISRLRFRQLVRMNSLPALPTQGLNPENPDL